MELLASQIAAASNLRALYPPSHPRVLASITTVLATLEQVIREEGTDSVTYLIVGDDLVAGTEVIRRTSISVHSFIEILKAREIERLTLGSGLLAAEAHAFLESLASNKPLLSSPHIIVGRARLVMDESTDVIENRRELSVEQVDIVREAWARFRVERKLPVNQLEELVWSFIDSMGKTTRAILPISQLREHDEYTFVHSVNVALLVLAQARSFGIWGPMLHAFGMAALLHDIGKLTTPLSVLNKPGKLDDTEWAAMKIHAVEGAWHLAKLEGAPPLSVIVAYEHHLRFDGRPNYPILRVPREPALASRMTAIADTFDAIVTSRPYSQPMTRKNAFEILRSRAGTFHDPHLVGNFIRIIGLTS
jgi:HD-GYP domain-containing protein (c-di-GMP phosphodiesterase class II)